jgi:hypothetical protein
MLSCFRARLGALGPLAAPALSLVFAASLPACSTVAPPPKVATISTDPPAASAPAASAEPASSAAPAAAKPSSSAAPRSAPADGDDATADADSEAKNKEKAAALQAQLEELQTQILARISSSGVADPLGGTLQAGSGGGSIGGIAAVGGSSAPSGPATVKGPSVSVSLGTVTVSGSPVANAAPVSAGMAAGFRRCLQKAVNDDPAALPAAGKLDVILRVDAGGAVTSAQATGAVPAAATRCIAARAKAAQFAPGSGGSTVIIPFSFQVTTPP